VRWEDMGELFYTIRDNEDDRQLPSPPFVGWNLGGRTKKGKCRTKMSTLRRGIFSIYGVALNPGGTDSIDKCCREAHVATTKNTKRSRLFDKCSYLLLILPPICFIRQRRRTRETAWCDYFLGDVDVNPVED
jgi:hypothetical protein